MDADIAIPVKRLVMDQNFGLVRTIEEKALRKWGTMVGKGRFRAEDRDAASAPVARKVSAVVALANPPPSNKKSTMGISFECTLVASPYIAREI
jgi:hypothetical protein